MKNFTQLVDLGPFQCCCVRNGSTSVDYLFWMREKGAVLQSKATKDYHNAAVVDVLFDYHKASLATEAKLVAETVMQQLEINLDNLEWNEPLVIENPTLNTETGTGLDLNILYELEQLCEQWREGSERAFNEDFTEDSETLDACANGLRRWLYKVEPMVRLALAAALTPREQQAIEAIEAVLNAVDDPNAGGRWADCGEVDVPILLDAVKRLNKLAVEYKAPKVEEVGVEPVVADFVSRIGGVGITMGLTLSQVLGLSTTMQELNITPELGGTVVVKILQKMTSEPEKFAKVAGLATKDFAHLVNTDLYEGLVKVIKGFGKGGSNATAMTTMLNELGVDGAGAAVMAKLSGNTELLSEKVKLASTSNAN